jgi:hypothetical protein
MNAFLDKLIHALEEQVGADEMELPFGPRHRGRGPGGEHGPHGERGPFGWSRGPHQHHRGFNP